MADLGHQTEPLRRHALDRNPEPTDAAVCHDPRTTSGDSEWARLLEACFAELHEAVESGDIARTSPLHEAVAELALIERGSIKPASRRGQKALRTGRLCSGAALDRASSRKQPCRPRWWPTCSACRCAISTCCSKSTGPQLLADRDGSSG